MEQPLVSVVLLTYNRPHYLKLAIISALDQTYQNLEILICNNASEPETSAVINEFHDSRIRHQRHATNIGMTENVRWGFLESKGKYVTNLHDDDLWDPTFIEKMVRALEENPEALIAFSDHSIIDASGNVNKTATNENTKLFARVGLKAGFHKPFRRLALVDQAVPIAVATVFRRDAIDWEDFNNLPSIYDFWLAYLTSRDGGGCYYLAEKLAYYRHHENSESTNARVRVNDAYILIYEKMMQDQKVADLHKDFIPRHSDHYRDAAIALLRSGDRKKARKYLKKGLEIHRTIKATLTYWATFLPRFITIHFPGSIRF